VWSNVQESYSGGSVATGRASQARQVNGDDPDKKRYSGPLGWASGLRPTTSSRKKEK
jgi:hypothetical protein